jgi:hypothetical protein
MIRLVIVASLLVGCRISLENNDLPPTPDGGNGRRCTDSTTSPACVAAVDHSDLTWIQANIFKTGCALSSSCHGSGGIAPNLSDGQSYASLVNVDSTFQSSRKRIVPNDIKASYLMLMVNDFAPEMAMPPGMMPAGGYMPKGDPKGLCCQKLDALDRWIMAGAQNN